MRTTIALPLFTLGLLAYSAVAAEADSYSKAVQQSCASDYKKYCGEYGLESTGLRGCMDRNGNSLSKTCVLLSWELGLTAGSLSIGAPPCCRRDF